MGGKASSPGTKSSKKKRNKVSSKLLKKKEKKKKKTMRKESKVLHSPDSDSVSLRSKSTPSTSSESDYRTRKNKSKKRCRDDSASSDDYSLTSCSDSLSTHNNKSYKKRKALPQGRKKGSRKRYGSAESDAELRRRKKSRGLHVVKSRNKSLKKKPRRRITSSSSSDSENCSTCDSRSGNSAGDGKHQRRKMILDKKSSTGRESHRARNKRKVRSPSRSSCSTCRDHDVGVGLSDEVLDHDISVDRSDEALVPVANSRRLKSVIAIVYRTTDEKESRWEKDPQKEEILCDHDDYPSPKSMDSNEEANKNDLDDQSHGQSNKRIYVENIENEVILPVKSGNIGNEGYNAEGSQSHEVHTYSPENEKESQVSVNLAPLDGDKKKDGASEGLELTLRQKALENLRRFKGGLQAARICSDTIQNKSTEPNSFLAREMDERSKPMLPEVEKDSDTGHTATDPPEAPSVLVVNDTNQAAGESSSKEQQHEAKTGSEFEQKTMSVMRGGEMVQVSYKVYIPKRAPALARRQLQR